MEKQVIVSSISEKLNKMGINNSMGNGTDITVNTEFLDAGWSTGSKKITYEAAIFADEGSNTVFMWEMTKEVGHGLSFGSESGSSFQSGKTLFRKVKSVQYGPDGKAYEYNLDLGAIPKVAKETAAQYGWKFKTVLGKNKAMYPAGYMQSSTAPQSGRPQPPPPPVPPAPGQFQQQYTPPQYSTQQQQYTPPQQGYGQQPQYAYNQQQQAGNVPPQGQQNYMPYNNPQGQFYANAPKKKGNKGGTFGLIGFIILGIIMAVFLAVGKATLTGWIVSVIVFAISLFIQRKLAQRGCLLNLILWIVTGFIMLVILTVFSTDSVSFTTANIKNARMTTSVDSSGKPADSVKSYMVKAPQLVCSAELHNAPENTKVKFVWNYITGNIRITEFVMESGSKGTNVYVFSNLTNDKPWPKGDYKVEMYIEDKKTPDATVDFKVTD